MHRGTGGQRIGQGQRQWLGIGFAPSTLYKVLPELIRAREDLGSPVSRVAQDAIARFRDTDEFQRHTARMRRSFRRRRSLLSDVLGGLPHVSVLPMAGGAHAVLAVPGVRQVDTNLVWEPQWGMDMMSDEARLELGML